MSGKYKWVDTSEPGVITYLTPEFYMQQFRSLPREEQDEKLHEMLREWLEEAENRARIKIERMLLEP